MFIVVDAYNFMIPIKSGFKTYSQTNNWCKKHLPIDGVRLWGDKTHGFKRYFVRMR